MKKTLCFLVFTLCLFTIKGQQFSVSYKFDDSFTPKVLSGSEAVEGNEVLRNGEKLTSAKLEKEGKDTFVKVVIQRNIRNLFYDANLRFDLAPKSGYKLNVESVKIVLKGNADEKSFLMVGASLNDKVPNESDETQTSGEIKLTPNFKEVVFHPQSLKAEGLDNASIWITGRGRQAALSFDIKEVIIQGQYEKSNYKPEINVSKNLKQKVTFGIDAERLWFWKEDMKEDLAKIGAGELKSDYVRVAVSCGYEREKGVIDESVYIPIIELMQSLKDVNPEIKFFASPRPLYEAYSKEERENIWGHKDNVPWAPYPNWILNWVKDGTKKMSDGTTVPKWIEGKFDVEALVQYYADYLNYMHMKGFKITYLDVTNEKQINTPITNQYLYENLPKKLNSGVNMPLLIVPSAWNIAGATEWLKGVDMSKNQHESFQIVSAHNTGFGGTCEEFMEQAKRLGKDAWNTELHGWVGIDNKDEVLNSEVFWEHLRAGFNGIDTWLFYGPAGGRGHTMVWIDGKERTVTRSTKYEIFKQVVNNSTGGNYVDISMPFAATMTTAFVKDNILSVWVLNKSKRGAKDVAIDFSKWFSNTKTIEVTKWGEGLPRAGSKSTIKSSKSKLSYDIDGESLYFFRVNLK